MEEEDKSFVLADGTDFEVPTITFIDASLVKKYLPDKKQHPRSITNVIYEFQIQANKQTWNINKRYRDLENIINFVLFYLFLV